MKTYRYNSLKWFAAVVMSLLTCHLSQAQTNILRIPEVAAPAGKTISMPVELENTSEIVAVQFDVAVPYNLTSENPVMLNQSRMNGHEVTTRLMSSYYSNINGITYKRYRFMVYSSDNAAIQGSSGNLLTLQFELPDNLTNGQQLPINIVGTPILSDRNGQNVLTAQQNGNVTIEVVPRPDLVPTHAHVAQTLASPGDELDFTWTVENTGDSITGAGWTEKVFLENERGTRAYVGTTAYEGQLDKGASVNRSAKFRLDDYPGISGNCRAVVQILPAANCGEIPMNQNNNTAAGTSYSLRVKKFLVLTPYKNKIPENSTSRYNCELRRTGDLGQTETFKVETESPRISFENEGNVRFDKNVSKIYIPFHVVDNTDINVDEAIAFIVNKDLNNGYDAVKDTLYVEENDLVPLTITLDKEDYNEGDAIKVTATVPARYYDEPLYVYLNIEQSKRFKVPARIAFEGGATTATAYIQVLQDKNPANDETIKLTATADKHQTAEALFVLHDDDTPAIELTLTPKSVSENAGPNAVYATLTRVGVTDNKITVKLTDDGDNGIYYTTKTLTLPAGTTTVNFPIGVRDNNNVDGDRKVHISASIYLTDCNCDAIGDKQTSVTDSITILDDDGPALSLAVSKATVLEGDDTGSILTISRNTTDNSAPLTVTFEHDGTDVSLPTSVQIPAGQQSTTAVFKALSNSTQEGDRTVSITAKATGFSSGTAWLLISDRTLPDAVITDINLAKTELAAGETTQIFMTVENIGAAILPAGMTLSIRTNGDEYKSISLPAQVQKGGATVVTTDITASNVPGEYNISAVINEKHTIQELLYVNNTSATIPLTVSSLYNFTIVADKTTCNVGDVVTLSGTAKNSAGNTIAAQTKVEPYIVFNGERIALEATTDDSGNFSYQYTIPDGYRGHFVFGVCNPGEDLRNEAGAFNVYGFTRTSQDYIKHNLYKDESYAGTIGVENMTSLPLHNLHAEVSGATDRYNITITPIAELEGNSMAVFNYTITGNQVSTGNKWEELQLHLVCDEGATLDVTLYNFTRIHTPKLTADVTSINTTVTKGVVRNYPLHIVNMGMAETGPISIAMPSGLANFVSLATPATMPSLQPGDTAQIILRFNPGDMDVNLIQKGSLGINCENGNGIPIYFNVKVVSESKGNLRVQVQDEATIYGNKDGEKPYVQGALVRLQDYNTGVTVAEGFTPDNTEAGILFENVPEGYYQLYVTAEKHNSYRQNILVSPGETTTHLATISYQAISVSWDVVETEVEDEYEIVTTLNFETQVPVPVVRINSPDTLDLGGVLDGSAMLFNIVARNDGLIEAHDVEFTLPIANGVVFTPLVETKGIVLKPEQSYVVPVRVTKLEEAVEPTRPRRAAGSSCKGNVKVDYAHDCGEGSPLTSYTKPVDFLYNGYKGNNCGGGPGGGFPLDPGNPSGPGGPGGPGGWPGGPGIGAYGDAYVAATLKILCFIGGCAAPSIPSPPCTGSISGSNVASCASWSLKHGGDKGGAGKMGKAAAIAKCIEAAAAASRRKLGLDNTMPRRSSSDDHDLLKSFYKKIHPYYVYNEAEYDAFVERNGAEEVLDMSWEQYEIFGQALMAIDAELEDMHNAGTLYSLDTLQIPLKADETTEGFALNHFTKIMPEATATWFDFSLRRYVDRRMNTYRIKDGMAPTSDNFMDQSAMDIFAERKDSCLAAMVELGFINWAELVESANKDVLEYYENASENVCASVKLEIEQKLVLTRQAFRGTLTIDNDTEGTLSGIDLDLVVKNLLGEQATSHEFQINFESIDGFEGSTEGPWTLASKAKGVATILFIPTKYAAPDTITTYSFGGTLYFTDSDGQAQVRELYPVALQVKPSPELDLTYFMQRDIYGDNPLTPDVLEPVIPAEFTVLLHNKGKGDATNVRMLTKQPKIVENEKNLAVDFAIVSSSMNGGEKALALDSEIATQFGDIPAGTCSYATWDLTSTLLGHFTDYDISVNHVTSYGNPDLSLLDDVSIHELIHSVNAKFGQDTYRAWACNDVEDGHAEPDHIYFANGTDEDLKTLSNNTRIDKIDATHYRVSVTVPQREWFYTAVANPGGALAKIVSLKDETTGDELDPQNFWTTQYTMQDGFDPLPENKLHIVAFADAPNTFKFLVEFEPQPEVRLDVVSIQTVPNDDDIATDVIDELTVTFNKGIQPETFTRKDIVLRYEGEKQTVDLPITMVENDSIFKLNTSALSENGYYVLQVRTDSIRDKENYLGYNGLQVKWMLFKGGLVSYNILPWPLDANGDITVMAGHSGQTPVSVSSTGFANYGDDVTITATPNEGYTFQYWAKPPKVDASLGSTRRKMPFRTPTEEAALREDQLEKFSTENPLSIELNQIYDLRAVFKPIPYTVSVSNDDEAGSVNVATGIYDYGTALNVEAAAKDGYAVEGFIINGNYVEGATTSVTVRDNTTIEVQYKDNKPQSVLLRDTQDYTPTVIEHANVTLQRSFRKGTWNTICLPFAVEYPGDVFGSGTLIARLTGMNGNLLQFDYVAEMEANVPYLIKPGTLNNSSLADGTSKSGVYFINETAIEVPASGTPHDPHGDIDFIGSYVQTYVPVSDGNYYISSNILYYVDADAVVPTGRFRGYFHASSYMPSRMGIEIGETVLIPNTQIPTSAAQPIYDLEGRQVRRAGEGLQGLPAGIYVTGGRKFVVR